MRNIYCISPFVASLWIYSWWLPELMSYSLLINSHLLEYLMTCRVDQGIVLSALSHRCVVLLVGRDSHLNRSLCKEKEAIIFAWKSMPYTRAWLLMLIPIEGYTTSQGPLDYLMTCGVDQGVVLSAPSQRCVVLEVGRDAHLNRSLCKEKEAIIFAWKSMPHTRAWLLMLIPIEGYTTSQGPLDYLMTCGVDQGVVLSAPSHRCVVLEVGRDAHLNRSLCKEK